MITEYELNEAIAECEGQRNPNANTCMKLAAFYTIKNQLYREQNDVERNNPPMERSYSFDGGIDSDTAFDSGTEFSDIISGMEQQEVYSVMDELMTALSVLNPRLYDSVLRKLRER